MKNNSSRKIQIIKQMKRVTIATMIVILNILGVGNAANAKSINSAHIYNVGNCGKLLTYKGVEVECYYVAYNADGVQYPAYCLDKTKHGVGIVDSYTVSVKKAVQDVGLWKVIINGYPYKSIEELNVANKEEAFTATKQAVYCYIHKNNLNDYAPIGEAGKRTLNALKKIVNDSQNSTETKISSTITINKNKDKWKQDSKDKNYLSKIYSVSAGTTIQNYKITVTKENNKDLGGIKITDENNKEKFEFASNEKFKILVPIKNTTENGSFNLRVEAKIKTKPILYGTAPNSTYQDYALTTAVFEDGIGEIKDEYSKNNTKIIVIKKDQEDGKNLEGTEFELLDENKNIIYTELKTNEEGKLIIENILPGTYYLKERKATNGYELYKELIEVEVKLDEEVTVTVNNKKEEKPTIQTIKSEKLIKTEKKLPVTGM